MNYLVFLWKDIRISFFSCEYISGNSIFVNVVLWIGDFSHFNE